MKTFKANLILFAFLCWSILSIALTVIEISVISRAWQASIFLIISFAASTIISQPSVLTNKIVRILIAWGMYVMFVNIFIESNPQYGFLNTFVDVIWFPCVFVLFYSLFSADKNSNIYRKLLRLFPYFYFVILSLVIYKMIFHFGSTSYEILMVEEINSVFWVLLLIPFAFLIDSRLLKYVILFSAFVLVLASSKRSATISLSLVVLMSLFYDFFMKQKALSSIPFGIFVLFVFISILNTTITKVNVNVLDRFEETNVYEESRLELYKDSWEKYKKKDLVLKIMGSGHRSTGNDRGSDLLSKTSHNDFLEVLYNYGVLGLILYFYFVWQITKRLIHFKSVGGKYYQSYLASYIIFIVMSMVSHLVIYPTYYAFLVLFWALMERRMQVLIRETNSKRVYIDNYSKNG